MSEPWSGPGEIALVLVSLRRAGPGVVRRARAGFPHDDASAMSRPRSADVGQARLLGGGWVSAGIRGCWGVGAQAGAGFGPDRVCAVQAGQQKSGPEQPDNRPKT